ncbi:MAG TPA: hypothetical protein VHY19_06430 [Steroidobacteraceae bacterium]|jgi:hypothetical protein|nr:hypothetical protein [Steroidobacteraceae bacterium]
MSTAAAEQLIAYARDHRPTDVVPVGDVCDPSILGDCITAILQDHLEGIDVKMDLAWLAGYLREATARKAAA